MSLTDATREVGTFVMLTAAGIALYFTESKSSWIDRAREWFTDKQPAEVN